jgi:quaternary ammonium compound-resistance protein SugE
MCANFGSGALVRHARCEKDISLGTSYAVWTGIGAAGTFLVGVWFFGDPSSLGRWVGTALMIGGVITLKLAH